MKHAKRNNLISIIVIFVVLYIFTAVVFLRTNSIQSNNYRGQLDTVRGHLATAERTNRELEEQLESANSRLEQISFLCEELGESTGRNITTVRQCIELLEEERYQIACIYYYASGGNSDSIYERIDSWLESEGVKP